MGSVCVLTPYELEHPICRPAGDLFCLSSYPCLVFAGTGGGLPDLWLVCTPVCPPSGWRRYHLLPHGGSLPRVCAALAAPVLSHGTQMDSISRSLTAVSFSFFVQLWRITLLHRADAPARSKTFRSEKHARALSPPCRPKFEMGYMKISIVHTNRSKIEVSAI